MRVHNYIQMYESKFAYPLGCTGSNIECRTQWDDAPYRRFSLSLLTVMVFVVFLGEQWQDLRA